MIRSSGERLQATGAAVRPPWPRRRSGATLSLPQWPRPRFFGGRFRASVERSPRRAVAALVIAALGAIGVVSTAQNWLLFRPDAGALAADSARNLIAAALWIPLGACAVALARRAPLGRGVTVRSIVAHLIAGACATALLNLAWATIIAVVGLWPDPALGFGRLVARSAIGYLHIDVPIWLLIAVVASAWSVRPAAEERTEPEPEGGVPDRIAVRYNGRTVLLEVERIDWIEAAGDYARLHAGARSFLVGERMHALETRLGNGFVRVHRSAIVNVARVREVCPRPAGDATLVLRDDTRIPLSRRRRADVLSRLSPP